MKNNRNTLLTESRKKLGLTIEKFEKDIGITPTYYDSIERLKCYPSKEIQSRISEYLALKGIDYIEEDLFLKKLYRIKDEYILEMVPIEELELPLIENLAEKKFKQEQLEQNIRRIFKEQKTKLKGRGERLCAVLEYAFGINDNKEGSRSNLSGRMRRDPYHLNNVKNNALKSLRAQYSLADFLKDCN